jgi:hypothetical protein
VDTGYHHDAEDVQMITVMSTIPHYLALLFTGNSALYSFVVFSSTTCSVYWQILGEPRNEIWILDYMLAYMWFIAELALIPTEYALRVTILNFGVLIANKYTDRSCQYHLHHSMWHLLSASKAIYVAWLFSLA